MNDWKSRWIELELIGDVPSQVAQFEAWQNHWLTLHPEDAPPTFLSDNEDEAVSEIFQNLDKYLNDAEVIELCQRHRKVASLDLQKLLNTERPKNRY